MGSTKRNFLFAGSLALALSGGLLSGCTQTTEAPSTTASVSTETTPPAAVNAAPGPAASAGETAAGGTNNAGTMPPGPASAGGVPPMAGGGAPFAGGAMGGDPNAPISPSPELDKKIVAAEKSGDKKAIGVAYTERGAARLYDEKAGARQNTGPLWKTFAKPLPPTRPTRTRRQARYYREHLQGDGPTYSQVRGYCGRESERTVRQNRPHRSFCVIGPYKCLIKGIVA
jgi:hypothetical protein